MSLATNLVDDIARRCNGFRAYFEARRSEWTWEEHSHPTVYGVFSILADFVRTHLDDLSADEVAALAELIEFHVSYESEAYTNDLLTGLFESLEGTDVADRFARILGPESRRAFG